MIGEVLFGRYRVDSLVSSTDDSDARVEVFEGMDLHALEPIHIKLWGRDQDPGPALLEGEAMAAARHPGVVRLVDFGLHEGCQPCLVMERVAGQTLAERLAEAGPLPWHEAFELGAQLLDGLAALHDEGLVHRDVSPHCVVLVDQHPDRVKLVGLEHVMFAGAENGPLLLEEPPSGVLEYKAPEQLAVIGVRPATDLYALGVVLWEAISGTSPFAAEPDGIAARIGFRPDFGRIPTLPVAGRLALDRMLRPSLAVREADARLCARRLRAAVQDDAARRSSEWARVAS